MHTTTIIYFCSLEEFPAHFRSTTNGRARIFNIGNILGLIAMVMPRPSGLIYRHVTCTHCFHSPLPLSFLPNPHFLLPTSALSTPPSSLLTPCCLFSFLPTHHSISPSSLLLTLSLSHNFLLNPSHLPTPSLLRTGVFAYLCTSTSVQFPALASYSPHPSPSLTLHSTLTTPVLPTPYTLLPTLATLLLTASRLPIAHSIPCSLFPTPFLSLLPSFSPFYSHHSCPPYSP